MAQGDKPLARRCTYCSVQFPPSESKCLICGELTWPMYKTGPDSDWRDTVKRKLGEQAYLPLGEAPEGGAYALPHPPDLVVALHIGDGRMWLPHAVLIDAGYRHLEDGSIVFVNSRFYELMGYSESRKMWWIEEMVIDGVFDNITPEDIINGG